MYGRNKNHILYFKNGIKEFKNVFVLKPKDKNIFN